MPKATHEISEAAGVTTIHVLRDYPSGSVPTAQRVWEIVSDFGSIKTIFPSVLRVCVSYPDQSDTKLGTIRDMTFAPAQGGDPLSSKNPLILGVEKLVAIEPDEMRLEYISVLGQPVDGYRSIMQVTGSDACTLSWTSKFTLLEPKKNAWFPKVLVGILAGGADQIAKVLKLD